MVTSLKEAVINTPEQTEELQTRSFPVLNTQALYGLAGDVVQASVRDSEVDPAAVLFTFLTAAGAAIGAGSYIRVNNGKHPTRLFVVVVGASGKSRKGSSAEPVEYLLELLEGEDSALSVRRHPGPLASGEGLIYEVRDPSEAKDPDTGEPLDPGVEDKRLFMILPEFDGALTVATREGNNLTAVMRQVWDKGDIKPATKHQRIQATGAHICLVGHITEAQLGLFKLKDIYNGLGNRILWVCARRQKLVPWAEGLSEHDALALAKRTHAVIQHAATVDRIAISPEVRQLWEQLYPRISADEPGIVGAIVGRAEVQVLRLALLYALLDCANTIEPAHLKAALAAWQYCRDSARYLWGAIELDANGQKLISFLKTGRKTQTEINKHFSGHLPAAAMRVLLEGYQATGRITRTQEGGGKGKGKPTTFWLLTPGFDANSADSADFAE